MNLPAECHELLQSLAHTTARLAGLDRADPEQVRRAMVERSRAIEAARNWIGGEQSAEPLVSAEIVDQLTRELESGARILVRLAIEREAMRSDLLNLGRELRMLNGLGDPAPSRPPSIDYHG